MKILEIEGRVIEIGSDDWKDSVLSADPFEGDFGSGCYLEDKIVKVRNTKTLCHGCNSWLKPETYTRSIVIADEGQILKARYCEDCCNDLGYGEFLFEDGIYIDIENDEEWDKACEIAESKGFEEPREYWVIREEIRVDNENYLCEKLGPDWWRRVPKEVLYNTMKERDNT